MAIQWQQRVPVTQEEVIASYQFLLECSVRMLFRARDEDWGSLIDEESRYVAEVEQLAKVEQGLALDRPHQERKAVLLRQILEQDREIRERLTRRREELSRLMGVSQRQRQLNSAYHPPGHRQ
ncbi:flagellar protein FliT [Zobellella aerophila]|uniref:Flagellar protein FliT n=1 Tax=Zobellella aerophila TaxID=870480 RepID=A0ABP6VWI9_9GAMM